MQLSQGNNLSKIKISNQSAIHRTLYHYGPITRSEIASRLGLTLPTITTNVNTMIADGIVREVGTPENSCYSTGRKANLIDIVPDSLHFLGVELRGSLRRLCITDYRGNTVYSDRDEVEHHDYDMAIQSAARLVNTAFQKSGYDADSIAGIGVGVPGIVDNHSNILHIHPRYAWENKYISKDLCRLTGYRGPISVENNSCARAFSAKLLSRELLNSVPSFAYLFISTGIACPLVINFNHDYDNPVGGGEVGHMVMDSNGPVCSCGNRGCLEAFSGDRAIIKSCTEEIDAGRAPVLAKLCDGAAPTMSQILKAGADGDSDVNRILHLAIDTLGIATVNVYNFVRPHLMLIEGILFTDLNLRARFLDIAYKNLYKTTRHNARFVFVDPDDFSGARGACAVAIRNSWIGQ